MSIENHIVALREKHAALDAKLQTEQNRPGADPAVLKELKQDKLRRKDEIAAAEKKLAQEQAAVAVDSEPVLPAIDLPVVDTVDAVKAHSVSQPDFPAANDEPTGQMSLDFPTEGYGQVASAKFA